MKKTLILVLTILFVGALITLGACSLLPNNGDNGDRNDPNHQHSYGDYIGEKDYHYRECSVCHELTTYDEHSFNGGTTCSVCGYTCNHTLSETWVGYDEQGHHHLASCGHREFDGEYEPHNLVEYTNEGMICETCNYVHYHHFETGYGRYDYDDEYHWRKPLCEHTELHLFEEKHDFDSNNRCTVCGYQHEHIFDTSDWATNDSGHYYAATCGHDVKQSYAKHDYDNYYKCWTCGYQHTHTQSEFWTRDDAYHWHAATCGHSGFTSEKTEHNYEYDGFYYRDTCVDCGYYRSHVHVYNGYETDNDQHWRICLLCDRQDNYGNKTDHDYDADYKCNTCGYQHVHEIDTELSFDNDSHYYAAHCNHVKVEYVAHNYDDDYKCLTCGAQHVHTTAATYSTDNDWHWYEITCGHDIEPDKLKHNLQYNTGAYFGKYVCQDCNWVHVHTFDYDVWASDVDKHYHPSTCGHLERISERSHSFVDDECTVCHASTNLEYEYLSAQGQYVVKGIGTKQGGSIVIPDTWRGGRVTGIARNAFKDVDFIVEITMSDNITSIGADAFSGCVSLQSVRLSNNITTLSARCFEGCASLQTLNMPTGLTEIQEYCFKGCAKLDFSLPSTITSLGIAAFYGCGITEINIPTVITEIPNLLMCGCTALRHVSIGDKVTSIGYYAFDKTAIENITLPNTLLSIGECAFRNTAIESITLPDSLLTIGKSAFEQCNNLTQVVVPDSVTSMGESAFYYCRGLTSVELGNGITTLPNYAFCGCSKLQTVRLGASIQTIGYYGFSGSSSMTTLVLKGSWAQFCAIDFEIEKYEEDGPLCNPLRYVSTVYVGDTEVGKDLVLPNDVTLIKTNAFYKCNAFDSITLPDCNITLQRQAFIHAGFTSVNLGNGRITWECKSYANPENNAFKDCAKLQTVTMGDNITEIGAYAFIGCNELRSVTLGNGVQVIGDNAFDGLSKLTEINLPESLTRIGNYAFNNCVNIEVDVTCSQLTRIGNYAFYNCGKISTVTFGDKLTNIGGYAFSKLPLLQTIVIPDNVTYIGQDSFRSCTGLTSITVGSDDTSVSQEIFANAFKSCYNVTEINLGRSVTYIGADAFASSKITELIIPDTVTYIGEGAFMYCSQLTKLSVPFIGSGNGEYTEFMYFFADYFQKWTGMSQVLTEVTVCGGAVAQDAFHDCPNITVLNLEGVTSVAFDALSGLTGITTLTLPTLDNRLNYLFGGQSLDDNELLPESLNTVTVASGDIAREAFCGTNIRNIYLLEGVKSIGAYAFAECDKLHQIILPEGLETIGDYAFYDSNYMWNIVLPRSLKYVGKSAFYCTQKHDTNRIEYQGTLSEWCAIDFYGSSSNPLSRRASKNYLENFDDLELYINGELAHIDSTFTVPEGTTRIGDYSLVDLVSLNLPASLREVNNYAFEGCAGLCAITIPEENDVFVTLSGVLYLKDSWEVVHVPYQIGVLTIPDSMVHVPENLFAYKENLACVYFNDNVVSIGKGAFRNCKNLTALHFGSGLQTIGELAFASCTSLKKLELPDSVISIGNEAFTNCKSLNTLKLNEGLETIGVNAFATAESLRHVTLPNSLTSIGRGAFSYSGVESVVIGKKLTSIPSIFLNTAATTLSKVYYYGEKRDWQSILGNIEDGTIKRCQIYFYSAYQPLVTSTDLHWHYDADGNITEWKN